MPFRRTRPPVTASVAAPRVLKNRAAQSHWSILQELRAGSMWRTIVSGPQSSPDTPPGVDGDWITARRARAQASSPSRARFAEIGRASWRERVEDAVGGE